MENDFVEKRRSDERCRLAVEVFALELSVPLLRTRPRDVSEVDVVRYDPGGFSLQPRASVQRRGRVSLLPLRRVLDVLVVG